MIGRAACSHQLNLPHGVDRIEQMGSDAVVVGTDGKDLHFSVAAFGTMAEIVSRYTRKAASQGELRSHGFFYKPDGETPGMLGLPISVPGRAGYHHLFESSAAILFLRNDSLQFRESASWARSLRRHRTIGVARRASIGTEMRDRCFCVADDSRARLRDRRRLARGRTDE